MAPIFWRQKRSTKHVKATHQFRALQALMTAHLSMSKIKSSLLAGRKAVGAFQVGSVADVQALGDEFRTDMGPDDFRHGDVVWAPFVVPNLDPGAMSDDHCIALSTIGGLSVKIRPMILAGICPRGLVALPMFTAGGKGAGALAFKDDVFPVLNATEEEPEIPGVRYGHALRIAYTGWSPKPGSHIRMSQSVFLDYRYPLSLKTHIDDESLVRLQKWHRMYLEKSYGTLEQQDYWLDEHSDGYEESEIDEYHILV